MSTPCKLIAPGAAVNGTMSITKTELFFEADEEDSENKALDNKVSQWNLVVCLNSVFTLHNTHYKKNKKLCELLGKNFVLFRLTWKKKSR